MGQSKDTHALTVLACASRLCSGDRALTYEILLTAFVKFAAESTGPVSVLTHGIDALAAARDACKEVG